MASLRHGFPIAEAISGMTMTIEPSAHTRRRPLRSTALGSANWNSGSREHCLILTSIGSMFGVLKQGSTGHSSCFPVCRLRNLSAFKEERQFMKRTLIAFTLAMVSFAVPRVQAEELVGTDLHKAVEGKTVFIYTPLGEVPIRYLKNGSLHGQTELALLDGESTTADRGRWWVAETKLCIQWQNWMGGRPHCFTMHRVGPNVVQWRRDDGKSGMARIG
jgi:hypothetical protein